MNDTVKWSFCKHVVRCCFPGVEFNFLGCEAFLKKTGRRELRFKGAFRLGWKRYWGITALSSFFLVSTTGHPSTLFDVTGTFLRCFIRFWDSLPFREEICWEIYWIELKINKGHNPKIGILNCLDWDFCRARPVRVYFPFCCRVQFDLFYEFFDWRSIVCLSLAFKHNHEYLEVSIKLFAKSIHHWTHYCWTRISLHSYLQICRSFQRILVEWIWDSLVYIKLHQSLSLFMNQKWYAGRQFHLTRSLDTSETLTKSFFYSTLKEASNRYALNRTDWEAISSSIEDIRGSALFKNLVFFARNRLSII